MIHVENFLLHLEKQKSEYLSTIRNFEKFKNDSKYPQVWDDMIFNVQDELLAVDRLIQYYEKRLKLNCIKNYFHEKKEYTN